MRNEQQEHLPLNQEGLTAYFDQMATDGKVETTVEWLVDIALLIQSDVERRHSAALADTWVAVSDRLPLDAGLYLGMMSDIPGRTPQPHTFWYDGEDWPLYLNIVAWMPMPQYTPGGQADGEE